MLRNAHNTWIFSKSGTILEYSRSLEILGFQLFLKKISNPELGTTWKNISEPEIPSSDPELEKISWFWPGTRKNFRVPTQNLENIFRFRPGISKNFRVSDIFCFFSEFFHIIFQPRKIGIFPTVSRLEPGIPVETLGTVLKTGILKRSELEYWNPCWDSTGPKWNIYYDQEYSWSLNSDDWMFLKSEITTFACFGRLEWPFLTKYWEGSLLPNGIYCTG